MARYAVAYSTTIIASPSAGAETIVATVGPLNLFVDSAPVFLFWSWTAALASGLTTMVTTLRRGTSTTATLVNVSQLENLTSLQTSRRSGCFVDLITAGAELFYSLGLNPAGGGATVNEVSLIAAVL